MPSSLLRPLVLELVPCPEPWQIARRLAHLPHLLFLDSAERQHSGRGRYSYVTASPTRFCSESLAEDSSLIKEHFGKPFAVVQEMLDGAKFATIPGLPPFQGGIAGLFAYDLCRAIERIPASRHDEFSLSRVGVGVGVYEWVISFDHVQNRAWIVSACVNIHHAKEQIRWVSSQLRSGLSRVEPRQDFISRVRLVPQFDLPNVSGVTSNFSKEGYIEAVGRAVEYVHAGDVFQVNISQRLLAPLREHPLDLYHRLRQHNPAPFAGYFDLGEFQIVSSSPERFLQLSTDGFVSTKPIKGTRPRGKTAEADAAIVSALMTNPKDRAENVMIVDLLRNDLGRVCEYGSVHVPKVCELETYSYVHHLVSEVVGRLRPGLGGLDLLRAAFPGGSVTGAPKVRAMEIIAELEPTARGPYCGSLGYIGFNGAMDTNILIRTFTACGGWLQFPVGGGVVADSDPAKEYEETLHKAAGLLRALEA